MKKNLLALILSMLVVVIFVPIVSAEAVAPEKEADIRRLMNATGAGNIGVDMGNQMIAQMRQMLPQVPDEFWTEYSQEFNADELVNLVIPIYAKYLSHGEITELIAFYETSLGKKLISVQPNIMRDSMMAGQKWGQAASQRIIAKIKSSQAVE